MRRAPANPAHHLNLATSLLRTGQRPAGLDVLWQAAERFPHDVRLVFTLATALDDAGQEEDAAEAYRAVLRLAPLHGDAQQRLNRLRSCPPHRP